MKSGVLTLLTDFGLSDSYVGVMKGAIASLNPTLTVIDLTHQIPPQNIAAARFALMTAVPYFPLGTVHLAVVDPGVGSNRRAIALAVGNDVAQPVAFLVGPDNGLFSGVWQRYPVLQAVELNHPGYWRRSSPSPTFHGRDIFAPVAAHLASGIALPELGTEIAPESLTQLPIPTWTEQWQENRRIVTGCIQAIDHFGNLITTIPAAVVEGDAWCVSLGDRALAGQSTYSDTPVGGVLALVGSHGWVEIAVNGGSAQTTLGLDWGAMVQVVM